MLRITTEVTDMFRAYNDSIRTAHSMTDLSAIAARMKESRKDGYLSEPQHMMLKRELNARQIELFRRTCLRA